MHASIDLGYPFVGRWRVRNSPADRVPSHGTALLATSYAIDFVAVDDTGHSAPVTMRSLLRREDARRFPGFERLLSAPVAGTVVGLENSVVDHDAHRGLPSVGYALTQRGRLRSGWTALAGNHVLIAVDGVVVALCHLRRGSVAVRLGQRVEAGEVIGRCGNSGNSTEPHVHVQAIDGLDVERAAAVPLTFDGGLPRNGEIVEVADHELG